MTPLETADWLLAEIAKMDARKARRAADLEGRIAVLQAEAVQVLSPLDAERGDLVERLEMLMSTETSALFAGHDKLDLEHGVLLHSETAKVRIPKKGVIEKIKAAGWLEAIQTVETVIRGVVEKWPDEKLAVIGAARKIVDTFSYELKP